MAQSKRSSNTQQTGGAPRARKAAGASDGASRGGASPRAKASAGKATAAARSGQTRAPRAASQQQAPSYQPEPMRERYAQPVLDDSARRNVYGVVVAVLGVAMLIAVLVPTSGVLTQGVSQALHAAFGLGAFLLPVCLLLWSVSFFVEPRRVVPGRVAIGLALIVVAVLGMLGIFTPGCAADSAVLFAEPALSERGGYLGNGLAWFLLTLVGQVVGAVVLGGMIVAGLIVVGLDMSDSIRALVERVRMRRSFGRARAEDARFAAGRGAEGNGRFIRSTMQMPGDVPANYAPTALFDPSRPLSQDAYGQDMPVGAPATSPLPRANSMQSARAGQATTLISFDAYGAPVASYSIPTFEGADAFDDPYGRPRSNRFGCGDVPGTSAPSTLIDQEEPAVERQLRGSDEAASNAVSEVAPRPDATTVLPSLGAEDGVTPLVDRRPQSPVPAPATTRLQGRGDEGGHEESDLTGASLPVAYRAADDGEPLEEVPARRERRRTRNASAWWDPMDDWERDDFDASARRRPSSAYIPGTLPGAPVTLDDVEDYETPADDVVSSIMREEEESRRSGADSAAAPAAPASPAVSAAAVSAAAAAAAPAAPSARKPASGRAPEAAVSHDEDEEPDVTAPAPAPARQQKAPAVPELPWETTRTAVSVAASTAGCSVVSPDDGERPPYEYPDPSVLERGTLGIERTPEQRREAERLASVLQSTLTKFGVQAEVIDWIEGPTCTTYEVNPGEGVRVNKLTALEDDIARVLACSGVRIYSPVPGTSYVGIEVPNAVRQTVYFGDVLPYLDGGPLEFAVGLDANAKPVHVDLARLPHMIVAGTTGSGKSVMMNTIIMSMLMRDTPDEVRLIMIDPKQVEFKDYDGIPHLIMPVVTDMRQATAALQWCVNEMERRYGILRNTGARDLKGYNKLVKSGAFENSEFPLQTLPSIVIFIDELADLMMTAKKDVEASIARLAQKARACGMHLVIATQSPRADIVTGLIRTNIACRLALKVAKGTDSKIILDQTGAEKLLPHGDMLFLQPEWGDKPRRIQGCWISDGEISQVVEHLKKQAPPEYNYQMAPLPGTQLQADLSYAPVSAGEDHQASKANDDEPLAWRAAELVVESQMGSTSLLTRRLKIGYARAGRVMDMLEEMGIVGPAKGSKMRDVLIQDLDELATMRGSFDTQEGEY